MQLFSLFTDTHCTINSKHCSSKIKAISLVIAIFLCISFRYTCFPNKSTSDNLLKNLNRKSASDRHASGRNGNVMCVRVLPEGFFYILCGFEKYVIMAFYNFLCFLTLHKICHTPSPFMVRHLLFR